jgi:hypothetical protein
LHASMVLMLSECCACFRIAERATQVGMALLLAPWRPYISRGGAVEVQVGFSTLQGCWVEPTAAAPAHTPAVKSGMLCSRGRRLLMMDADGATKVSDLDRLEAKLEEISSERAWVLCRDQVFRQHCAALLPCRPHGRPAYPTKQCQKERHGTPMLRPWCGSWK